MLSAVITGMIGLHIFQRLGWIKLRPKSGSWGKNAVGGLIFGLGFALLGYCPGTIAGAIGNGYLDAATAGLVGIILGSRSAGGCLSGIKSRYIEQGLLR